MSIWTQNTISMPFVYEPLPNIDLPDIIKGNDNIGIIELNFENCETIAVYHDEIVDAKFECSEELRESAGEFCRLVTGGYMRIAFSDRSNRMGTLFNDKESNMRGIDDIDTIIKRLCGNGDSAIHDICNLYITHGVYKEERLIVESVAESAPLEECNCGKCKRLSDGSVLIAFGKRAEQTIKLLVFQ